MFLTIWTHEPGLANWGPDISSLGSTWKGCNLGASNLQERRTQITVYNYFLQDSLKLGFGGLSIVHHRHFIDLGCHTCTQIPGDDVFLCLRKHGSPIGVSGARFSSCIIMMYCIYHCLYITYKSYNLFYIYIYHLHISYYTSCASMTLCVNYCRRKFGGQTSDNMDRWKSRGGKSQRRERQKKEDQRRGARKGRKVAS